MQSEEVAGKAADAIGVTPYSDMRPFVEHAVKWALEQAALSTDAEPVKTAPSVAVKALADAYKAGFDASSQGYNGEVFPEYEADNEWLAQRDSDLSALSAQVQDVAMVTR